MSDLKTAATLALEALTATMSTHGFREYIEETKDKAIKALEEALAKQDQGEPVAWMRSEGVGSPIVTEELCQKHPEYRLFFTVPLYTTPQPAQKPWVGLTDEELRQIWYDDAPVEGGTYVDKLRQVEAKLKEKNT